MGRIELVGDCAHKSDLDPRDKQKLGGFASGGTFVGKGKWRPHHFKKVKVQLVNKSGNWVALIKGALTGLPAAVSEPQPSAQAARQLAVTLIKSRGWVSV